MKACSQQLLDRSISAIVAGIEIHNLSILNRHRALGIRTFRAFSAAASDARTKDAVLMETTHSIFSNSATGLINDPANDAEPNIIQIAGKVMDNANGK